MTKRMWMLAAGVAGSAAVMALGGVPAWQPDEDEGEVEIKLSEAPEAVRRAVAKVTNEKSIKKVIKETDDDIITYEVEYAGEGGEAAAKFSAAGETLELEKPAANLPQAVRDALAKEFKGATIGPATAVQEFYYEVELTMNGKAKEVKVCASGDVEDDEEGNNGEDDEGEDDEGEEEDDEGGR